jgi:hypothetical protein
MSPMRLGHKELGLELVSLEDNRSCHPKRPPMAEEKRDAGAEDSINMLLEESLMQQRDEMMENFSQILRQLPTTAGVSSSRNHIRSVSPFKVQVNFYIPVFEGQIDVNALETWLNLLECFFFVHNFFDREKITFALLKVVPHVKY